MVRHYLSRIDDATPQDEWSYISEIGNKVEIKDVMDVPQRYITFSKKLLHRVKEKKKPPLQATKEGIRWALDAAGNTGQYIKFVNMTIDKRQNQINKIKTLQGKFDKEIELLKSNKLEKIKDTQSSLAVPDIQTVGDYLNQILLEKRMTQSNLQNLQKDLISMEKEVKLQEKQIEGVRTHLKAKIIQGNAKEITTIDAIKIIREELSSIATKYDVSKLSMAVDKVVSSKAVL